MSALSLTQLHADIDARVRAFREDRPEWPCAKGCDGCCRRLAGVPQLTPAEWSQLREGLATLSPESLRQFSRNMAGLAAVDGERPRHIVCPLLDHVLANLIDDPKPSFPFLCLTVSGGHTQIVLCEAPTAMKVIGETIDDAAGEAFDKSAKLLGLPYPGGPLIDKYAKEGDHTRFKFPEPQIP